MKVVYDLKTLTEPLKNPVLTIGNFDGVHRGHLILFEKVKERARAIQGQCAVMTFDPHPLQVMKPGNGPSLITPTAQKLQLIGEAGIEVLLCIPFTPEFASTSAQDFVKEILVGKIGIREIVVGYDYTFGHNREGNIHLLKDLGDQLGFKVHRVGPVHVDHLLVSSTSIRRLLKEGRLSETKLLLGRDFEVEGKVVRGENRGGRLLGFPTANLKVTDQLLPRGGVYAVQVTIREKVYQGVTNIGYNPTFGEGSLSVETHLLDFSGDLIDQHIKVAFLHYLREEKRFTGIQELIDHITQDIREARRLFGLHSEG